MRIKKGQVSNIVFLIVIIVLLFTPAGTSVKVWINRLMAFSPDIVKTENRIILTDYNWQLENASSGKTYNFTAAKGKVVLVNLWATWCPPCIAEMPGLQALYDDYGDEIEFLFVTNDKRNSVKTFMQKNNYTFPVFYERTTTPSEIYSKTIPATYLIDRKGNIVIDETGAADWNSKEVRNQIEALLKE